MRRHVTHSELSDIDIDSSNHSPTLCYHGNLTSLDRSCTCLKFYTVAGPNVGGLAGDENIPLTVIDGITIESKRHSEISKSSKTSRTSKTSKTSKASKTSKVSGNGSTNYDYASDGSGAKVLTKLCLVGST